MACGPLGKHVQTRSKTKALPQVLRSKFLEQETVESDLALLFRVCDKAVFVLDKRRNKDLIMSLHDTIEVCVEKMPSVVHQLTCKPLHQHQLTNPHAHTDFLRVL